MAVNKKTTVILAVFCIVTLSYFTAPFVILPYLFSDTAPHWLSRTWNGIFSPMINSLDEDNWYRREFQKLSLELCEQNPDRCANENSQ